MNLKDQYIFILGNARYDSPFESTSVTVARYLAAGNDVFYIDNPFTWKDYFKRRDSQQFKNRKDYFADSSFGLIDTAVARFKILITSPLLSLNFLPEGPLYRLLLKYNERLIARRIKLVMKKYGIKDFIFINFFNFHYPNVGDRVGAPLKVYYCVDPLIIPFDMKHGFVSEDKLVRESDLVICTSRQLYEENKERNKETYFIANAADISHSSKALSPDLQVHSSILALKKPVIGYFGAIERRMDYDLLHEAAKQNPDKSFVLAGPVSPEFTPGWLYNTPNVHLPGRVPYDQMPAMIKGFDIAIIPFKSDKVSRTIFPLKLFEYLGAGKPVISTDFNPDLKEFTKDAVVYCSDADAFSAAISTILKEDNGDREKERLAIASENTWEARIRVISSLLANALGRKKNPDHTSINRIS
ncbi:glycosyltransferase [Hufsiella ginkgonis]|uniref:Glycosyltransferase n=1 Tax=Hufsiella ginkgonis TaxID=2695274 RepID=A0A7K1XZD9_9SPHI|nr:glycosyltransferase [Hufsiella ginkgonis]MXV16177.1 glycosyltransferase [Hufsiella ginkgonis]